MTKPSLLDRWQEDALIQGMGKPTVKSYRYAIKDFEKSLRDKYLWQADKMDIRAYVDACRTRGITTATISLRLICLSHFFEFLVFEGRRKDNPVPEVRKRYLKTYKRDGNAEVQTHKLISVEEAARLLDAAVDIQEKAILLVLLKTGIRKGELLSLDVTDINWQNQSITLKPVTKRTNRIVFFDEETANVLRRWLSVREYRNKKGLPALWLSSWGTRLQGDPVFRMIQEIAVRTGLHNSESDRLEDHFSPHCCRHWFTTHLLRADMKREYVQWLRGDAIKEAVDIYFHVDPEDVRKSYLAHVPQLGI